jgi:hypothetical protein
MAEGDKVDESRAEIDRVMEERDKLYLNPVERSLAIYEYLHKNHPELTTWDLVCFSSYWLATMSPQFPWLRPVAREAVRMVTFAHYNMKDPEQNLPTVLQRVEKIMDLTPEQIAEEAAKAVDFVKGSKDGNEPPQ